MLLICRDELIINMQNVEYIDIKKDEDDYFYLKIRMTGGSTYNVEYRKDEREIKELIKKIESYYKTSQRICRL